MLKDRIKDRLNDRINESDREELFAGLRKLRIELQKLRKENRDPEVEHNIHLLITELFIGTQLSPGLIRRIDEIPSKEVHYSRNENMADVPKSPAQAVQLGWDDSVGVSCHQFTSPDRTNVKFVSPDGHSEVIYNQEGNIVTASEDYGTYNFVDSRQDAVGHFYQDILPWLLWGNDETDSTDMRQRLRALVVYGGVETIQTHLGE